MSATRIGAVSRMQHDDEREPRQGVYGQAQVLSIERKPAAGSGQPAAGSGFGRLRARAADEVAYLHGDAVERLARLRKVLPLMGQELAMVRREAARLRLENRKLLARVHELEHGVLAHRRSA